MEWSNTLLPTTTESLVEFYNAVQFIQSDLGERQLGLKQVAIGIESVQQCVHAAAIADVGQPGTILQRIIAAESGAINFDMVNPPPPGRGFAAP